MRVDFGVLTFLIGRCDIRTPGRDEQVPAARKEEKGRFPYKKLLAALGGRDNIARVDNCITRLRVWVKDTSLLDEDQLRALAPEGLIFQSKEVQIVFGFDAVQARRQLEELLGVSALSP